MLRNFKRTQMRSVPARQRGDRPLDIALVVASLLALFGWLFAFALLLDDYGTPLFEFYLVGLMVAGGLVGLCLYLSGLVRSVAVFAYLQALALLFALAYPDEKFSILDDGAREYAEFTLGFYIAALVFVPTLLLSLAGLVSARTGDNIAVRLRQSLNGAALSLPVTLSAFLLAIFSADVWQAIEALPSAALLLIVALAVIVASHLLAPGADARWAGPVNAVVISVVLFTTYMLLVTLLVNTQLVIDWSGVSVQDGCFYGGRCPYWESVGALNLKLSLLFTAISTIAVADAKSILPPRSRAAAEEAAEVARPIR